MRLLERRPGAQVTVLEKEREWAAHQTGRNSGVIHSGIYYKPGSLKARLAREGNRSMVEFCRRQGVSHEICGKVIIATDERQLPELDRLYTRGRQNGLEVLRLSASEVRECEPYVQCVAGLSVPSTGIVNYRAVSQKIAELIQDLGGRLQLGARVLAVQERNGHVALETTAGPAEAAVVVNCAGLHSDRVAKLAGVTPQARIVPFRGEYFQLRAERCHLVKGLIYPVPNPAFPFLGVHFTRMIDGSVHAGPNAVLSFKREGYGKFDFSLRDVAEVILYSGFWRLAGRHAREGLREMRRSLSKSEFVRSLRQLIPDVRAEDLVEAESGVRAQALLPSGELVDDFLIVEAGRTVHVCNAPSPAATASLEIGQAIADRVEAVCARVAAAGPRSKCAQDSWERCKN